MKNDIDCLMKEKSIDALWITGGLQNNPDMVYFTGIQHVNQADLFKIYGRDPILYYFVNMEREEAARSGLETHPYFSDKPLKEYLQKNKANLSARIAARMKEVLEEMGLTGGRVAISGMIDLSYGYALIEQLKLILPDIEFISFLKDSVIAQARMTKSSQEIDLIRHNSLHPFCNWIRVRSFLQGQNISNGHLVFTDGKPITVKDVKSRIRLWLAELGADNPKETIFAVGRDGGIPHSSGSPDDVITLGKPIVFDIFP